MSAFFYQISFIMSFYYHLVSVPILNMLRDIFFLPDIMRNPDAFAFLKIAIASIGIPVGISGTLVFPEMLAFPIFLALPVDSGNAANNIHFTPCHHPHAFNDCKNFACLIPVTGKTIGTYTCDYTCGNKCYYGYLFHSSSLFAIQNAWSFH